jgi:hypothetical protein
LFGPPFGQPAIQNSHLIVPVVTQRPPQPGRARVVSLSIGHDPCFIADANCGHDPGKLVRRQEQVTHPINSMAQIEMPIEMNRPWNMAGLVQVAAGAIPAPARIYNP